MKKQSFFNSLLTVLLDRDTFRRKVKKKMNSQLCTTGAQVIRRLKVGKKTEKQEAGWQSDTNLCTGYLRLTPSPLKLCAFKLNIPLQYSLQWFHTILFSTCTIESFIHNTAKTWTTKKKESPFVLCNQMVWHVIYETNLWN